MQHLRALIRGHRHLAIALVMLAFCIKAIMPAGFMVSPSSDTVLTISICSETTGTLKTVRMAIPAKDDAGKHADQAKDSHCAFAGLGKVSTGAVDAVLLAIAFAFILAIAFAPAPRAPARRTPHFMPPLRGPPAAA